MSNSIFLKKVSHAKVFFLRKCSILPPKWKCSGAGAEQTLQGMERAVCVLLGLEVITESANILAKHWDQWHIAMQWTHIRR